MGPKGWEGPGGGEGGTRALRGCGVGGSNRTRRCRLEDPDSPCLPPSETLSHASQCPGRALGNSVQKSQTNALISKEFGGRHSLFSIWNSRVRWCLHAKKWLCQNYNFQTTFFYSIAGIKKCNSDKKIAKATQNDCYFNRYGCSLYRNNAWSSVL